MRTAGDKVKAACRAGLHAAAHAAGERTTCKLANLRAAEFNELEPQLQKWLVDKLAACKWCCAVHPVPSCAAAAADACCGPGHDRQRCPAPHCACAARLWRRRRRRVAGSCLPRGAGGSHRARRVRRWHRRPPSSCVGRALQVGVEVGTPAEGRACRRRHPSVSALRAPLLTGQAPAMRASESPPCV